MNLHVFFKVKDYLMNRAIFVVLVLLVIGIAIADPNFLAFSTLRDILQQSSTRAIIALGAAFILITGGVDLSAGRVVGLTAVISHPCCNWIRMRTVSFRICRSFRFGCPLSSGLPRVSLSV